MHILTDGTIIGTSVSKTDFLTPTEVLAVQVEELKGLLDQEKEKTFYLQAKINRLIYLGVQPEDRV